MTIPSTIAWTVRGEQVFTPAPFGILGIVNVTPDSFYDGGRYDAHGVAFAQACRCLAEGAHIIDLGAESSRPGSDPVAAAEEWRRLASPLTALVAHIATLPVSPSGDAPACPPLISIDTYHADTARAALDAGAHIINDISACAFEPALLEVVADYKPGYVLMHSQGVPKTMQVAPHYDNILDEMRTFFHSRLHMLTRAGLPEDRIVLDPGIGFGKTLEHNLTILRHIEIFNEFGRPLLMALSMKSLFRDLLGLDAPDARGTATQVATTLLAARGVPLHRVHDVAGTAQSLRLLQHMQPV